MATIESVPEIRRHSTWWDLLKYTTKSRTKSFLLFRNETLTVKMSEACFYPSHTKIKRVWMGCVTPEKWKNHILRRTFKDGLSHPALRRSNLVINKRQTWLSDSAGFILTIEQTGGRIQNPYHQTQGRYSSVKCVSQADWLLMDYHVYGEKIWKKH